MGRTSVMSLEVVRLKDHYYTIWVLFVSNFPMQLNKSIAMTVNVKMKDLAKKDEFLLLTSY